MRAHGDPDPYQGDEEEGDDVTLDGSTYQWPGEEPLRLRTSKQVHFDPLNLPLLAALPRAIRPMDAVLYHGCGIGLLGLLALRAGAGRVHFADVLPGAVDLAASNARNAGFRQGEQWTAALADLRARAGSGGASVGAARGAAADGAGGGGGVAAAQYDLILCNPPQLAGPAAMAAARPDRYAGPRGTDYYEALAALAASALRRGGRVALMQTSLSSFSAVDALFVAHGLAPTTLASQPRAAAAAAFEALAPGTLAWLLALRARGAADFRLVDASGSALPAAPAPHGDGPGRACTLEPTQAETQATVQFSQRLVVFE